jgi:predicted acetyltransferase
MKESLKPSIIPATIADYQVIQNMARFYVYDISRECGFISSKWDMSANGLYECFDLKIYFEDECRFPYLIKIGNELAGFILVDKEVKDKKSHWNMGEFFILAKFQSKGIGKQVAQQVFGEYTGVWEVSVIPENRSGLIFWERVVGAYTDGNFSRETKIVDFDECQPRRIIFTFDTNRNAINI